MTSPPSYSHHTMAEETTFDKYLTKFYRWHGQKVARHPWVYIISFTVVSLALSLGMLRLGELIDLDLVKLSTPINARAYYEHAAALEHWPIEETNFLPGRMVDHKKMSQAIFTAKDGGNLFRPLEGYGSGQNYTYVSYINDLNKYILENVTVTSSNGTIYRYEDICYRWRQECSFRNEHINVLSFMVNESPEKLTYPLLNLLSDADPIYIGNTVGGVTTNAEGWMDGKNSTDGPIKMRSIRALYMVYYIRRDTPEFAQITAEWETAYENHLKQLQQENGPVQIYYMVSTSLSRGTLQVALGVIPYFTVAFTLLFVFTSLMMIRITSSNGKWGLDLFGSRPFAGALGLVGATLSIGAAFGLLLASGFKLIALASIIPFLVVSIAIDDAFIVFQSWSQTDPKWSVEDRMSETMSDAAVSITITSVTSALSFAVGMTSSIPFVYIFCAYTSLSIMVCYLSIVTFFAGIMALAGHAEKKREICGKIIPQTRFVAGGQDEIWGSFFRNYYGPILMKPATKILVLLSYAVYLGIALYGCSKIQEDFRLQDILPSDFHANHFLTALQTYMNPSGQQVEIVIHNAPNLTLQSQREKLSVMVSDMEKSPYTMPKQATFFWLRQFELYLTSVYVDSRNEDPPVWSRTLYGWTKTASAVQKFAKDLAWRKSTPAERAVCRCSRVLSAFRFGLGMRNIGDTLRLRRAGALIRSLARKYPEYNITTYMYDFPVLDQFNVIPSNTLTNIAIALACMICISVLFYKSIIVLVCIALAIISIDIAVIGYMSLWSINLDVISMITILMSIGFSVDYSAHICYGFLVAKGTPSERAIQAVAVLGMPILQGAISTILGSAILLSINVYMIQTFFRIILIVILSGVYHACAVIPVLLTITELRNLRR